MSLKYLIDSIKSDVKEYCYNVYGGDEFMENEILNMELKNLGIINGEDEMVWKSPDKSICFEVSREYSTMNLPSKTSYRYICTLNVKNNLGITLDSFKFTEIDTINILEAFVYFHEPEYCYFYFDHDDHNVVYTNISPQDTSMETRTISLEHISSGPTESVMFTLQKYNPFYQQIVPIVKIPMTYEQLNDLAFHLFFAILIDIEVPEEFDEIMLKIEDYVTTENYWTFNRRRQELVKLSQHHPEKSRYAESFIENNAYYVQQQYTVPMNTVVPPVQQQEIQHVSIPKKKKRNIVMQLRGNKK